MTTFGCVLLTTGRKPDDLRLAVGSLLRQRGDVRTDIAVVGNGWRPEGLPDGVRGVHVEVDEGIPAGRNAGVPHVDGELLFFLDDDASLRDDDALERVAALFAADPALGMVQLEVAPRAGGEPLRDWVPRLRVGDRSRPSDITVVWEGAVAVRRDVFERVGGWPEAFRYVHEGIDLGWRVMDAGYRVFYAGGTVALHPVTGAPPHGYSYYYGARNRVWLARRHLPLPLGALYVVNFAVRSLPRYRTRRPLHEAQRGYPDRNPQPCRQPPPQRAPPKMPNAPARRPPVN
jgi:GT2 family glycosyltransferase